ncbi:flagellar protein FlgN [Priestia megaterium]|nr:flagellar protein FlgN [Priestia megaterium]
MNVESVKILLEKQLVLHKSLLTIAEKKTSVIVQQDVAELTNLLKDEQAHVTAITALEQQRMAFMSDMNVSLFQDETAAASLQPLQQQLIKVIEEIQRQNELNQQLLTQSLQLINTELDLLIPSQQTNSYNYAKDENQPVVMSNAIFQSKA